MLLNIATRHIVRPKTLMRVRGYANKGPYVKDFEAQGM